MSKRLLIIGAGGHGKVAADCAEMTKLYSEIAFLDKDFPELKQVGVWTVIGDGKDLSTLVDPDTYFFVAIGDNHTRAKVITLLLAASGQVDSLIHPSAVISRYADIGQGTLVCANAVINIGAKIGCGCIVNTSSSVDHDCQIEDYVHLAPGARLAGNVYIGEEAFIGIGCTIVQGIALGENCILGAGSILLEDLPKHSVAVGTPAKVIKQN